MNWIMLALSGSYLITFGIIFSYFWAATRYMEDVMPSLLMISVIGFLQGYKALSQRPGWKRLYTSIGLILASGSILISTMVGLSINDARFVIINLLSAAK
jgi:6-phosphogluconate dehydrogenase